LVYSHSSTKQNAGKKNADMIDGDLSPKNLTYDGKLPRSQVQARYRQLNAAAQELCSLDPTVKFCKFS